MSDDWREWSQRYVPRRRTWWEIGDRFQMNRVPEPLVFEITEMTPTTILFWAPAFDHPDDRTGRRCPRAKFLADVRARRLVRA